jgi:hypothetical protein
MTVQQPAAGKTQPVPHSSPGRLKLLPLCGSGPQTGLTTAPSGPVALTEKSPLPVMRQTTLISLPAVSDGPVGKKSPHSVAPSPVPCRSGNLSDPPNSAVAGHVEIVTGAVDPDVGRSP